MYYISITSFFFLVFSHLSPLQLHDPVPDHVMNY